MASPGAGASEQLLLIFRADIRDMQQKLAEASAHLRQWQQQTQAATAQAAAAHQSMASRVTGALNSMVGPLQNVAAVAVSVFGAAVAEAAKMEQATTRLSLVLRGQGQDFQQVAPRVKEWARSLSEATGIVRTELVQGLVDATARHFTLAQSMTLVHAATRISVATGRDLSDTLNIMERGALGFGRGLAQLGIITREEMKNGIRFSEVLRRVGERFPEADAKSMTFNKSLAILNASLAGLLEALGEPLLKPLTRLVLSLAHAAQAAEQFVKSLPPGTIQIVAFAAALFGAQRALTVFAGLAQGVPIVGRLATAAAGAGAGWVSMIGRLLAGLGPIGQVGAMVLRLLGPIGLVIGGVALLSTAWSRDWFHIREVTARAVQDIERDLGHLGGELNEARANMGRWLMSVSQAGSAVHGLGESMVSASARASMLAEAAQSSTDRLAAGMGKARAAADPLEASLKAFENIMVRGMGVGGANKLEEALRKAMIAAKDLYELGRIPFEQLVAVYQKAATAAGTSAEFQAQAQIQLTQVIDQQVRRQIGIIAAAIADEKITYEKGFAEIQAVYAKYAHFLTPMQQAEAQREISRVVAEAQARNAQSVRQGIQESITWMTRMRDEFKISAAEIDAGFARVVARIRDAGAAGRITQREMVALLAEIAKSRLELESAVRIEIERGGKEMAKTRVQMERDLTVAIATLSGNRTEVAKAQAAAELDAKLEAVQAYEDRALQLIELEYGTTAEGEARRQALYRETAALRVKLREAEAEQLRRIEAQIAVDDVKFQVESGQATRAQLEAALQEQLAILRARGAERSDEYRRFFSEVAALYKQDADQYFAIVERETGKNKDELLKRLLALREYYAAAAAANAAYYQTVNDLDQRIARLQATLQEENKSFAERWADATVQNASAFGNFVSEVVKGHKTIGQAFNDLVNSFIDAWTKALSETITAYFKKWMENLMGQLKIPGFGGVGGTPPPAVQPAAAAPPAGTEQISQAGTTFDRATGAFARSVTSFEQAVSRIGAGGAAGAGGGGFGLPGAAAVEGSVLGATVDDFGNAVGNAVGTLFGAFPVFQGGGTVRVPSSGAAAGILARVHPGERITGAAAAGTPPPVGGEPATPTLNLTIQAIDAQGVQDFFVRNNKLVSDAMTLATRGNSPYSRAIRGQFS